MPDLSNQLLVERCINGDKSAWDKFVQRFSRLIYWAIKEKLKYSSFNYTQQDTKDIFQDVFVLLWEKRKLEQIRNRENIATWLVIVAANCTLNYFRSKKEEFIGGEFIPQTADLSNCRHSETFEQEEQSSLIEQGLAELSVRERIILKLNYLHNKTHLEISQILKMPPGTISSIIKRIKERLKEKLKKQGWENF